MPKFSIKNVKFLFAGLLFSSCGSVYYAPNTHNVPLFQEKGDAKISAGISAGEDVERAFELQSAYAITDHVGIMANLYRVKQDDNRGTLFELGAGYFQPLEKHLVIEGYGGISYAQVINSNSAYTEYTDFTRYFIQPALGYSRNAFEVALSTRFAVLNYHRIEDPDVVVVSSSPELAHLMSNNVQFLFEPALTVRVGWKYVKLQGQFGFSKNLSDDYFDMDNLNLNVGLYFSLSNRYK